MTDAFRDSARQWLADHLPDEWKLASAETRGHDEFLDIRRRWGRMLSEGGWMGLSWPEKYGGRGLSLHEEVTFAEEEAHAEAPNYLNRNSAMYIGPTIITHGTDAQKARYLPPILAGEEVWCQGYSEPNAGSDLASLSATAVRRGDAFVVNGQKVWITLGAAADFCYLLARTDPERPRHRGISAFIVDMKSAGITVRDIVTISGSREFSEIFFDDVEVPAENLLGELNAGWKVAMTTLGFERSINFFARANHLRREVDDVADLARRVELDGRPAIEHGSIAHELACCAEEADALLLVIRRHLPEWARTRQPGPESSIIKVLWSEAHQRLSEVALAVLGPWGQQRMDAAAEGGGRWPHLFLTTRAETIYAGTSQVQRNVIAQRLLGLPREGSRK